MQKSKKIVLLGHFGVGKTSLIRQFVNSSFSESYKVTIGVHISKKELIIETLGPLSLIIWDIEGTKDLNSVRDAYLLGTDGVLYVFDITRPKSYENIQDDLKIIKQKCPKASIQIIGNKLDLIEKEVLNQLDKKNQLTYDFLTSAKTGEHVNTAFLNLVKNCILPKS
ncbi:Rab family GTPase [Croceitalea sp. MTPC9]|uniref:Rab family GTPase n=1 Tax=Croceitalea marina TaxID=1775166 RepID=A0ABW5N3P2_9FLAO|nr:Rab family GTPase [Croceitalea sp. MTPC6]GMN16311.1 Rab family GTPase [Croceitalea sp. MTPC9]